MLKVGKFSSQTQILTFFQQFYKSFLFQPPVWSKWYVCMKLIWARKSFIFLKLNSLSIFLIRQWSLRYFFVVYFTKFCFRVFFLFYYFFYWCIVAQILILMCKTICKCWEKKSRAGQKMFSTSARWEYSKGSSVTSWSCRHVICEWVLFNFLCFAFLFLLIWLGNPLTKDLRTP